MLIYNARGFWNMLIYNARGYIPAHGPGRQDGIAPIAASCARLCAGEL